MSEKALLVVVVVLCAVIAGLLASPPRERELSSVQGPQRAAAYAQDDQEASWQEQLVYLGYLLYRTSNINVINGLNLTPLQLEKLRALAVEIEGEVHPFALRGRMSPEVKLVADACLELKKTLLANEPVTDEMKKKIARARGTEAKLLKEGLTYRAVGSYGDCMRCHAAPAEYAMVSHNLDQAKAGNQAIEKEQTFAHIKAAIGNKGMALIWKKAPDVDRILNENQKLMIRDFSCCLIPPQDLSNPVRIGQAAAPTELVAVLEKVRLVPGDRWAGAKASLLKKLEYGQTLKSPDISVEKIKAFSAKAGDVLEKARTLSDADFELQKEELAAEMTGSRKTDTTERGRLMMQAFFLLMPGSREAYDAALGRMGKEGKK